MCNKRQYIKKLISTIQKHWVAQACYYERSFPTHFEALWWTFVLKVQFYDWWIETQNSSYLNHELKQKSSYNIYYTLSDKAEPFHNLSGYHNIHTITKWFLCNQLPGCNLIKLPTPLSSRYWVHHKLQVQSQENFDPSGNLRLNIKVLWMCIYIYPLFFLYYTNFSHFSCIYNTLACTECNFNMRFM